MTDGQALHILGYTSFTVWARNSGYGYRYDIHDPHWIEIKTGERKAYSELQDDLHNQATFVADLEYDGHIVIRTPTNGAEQ